jgi:hypothetical protein
MRLRQLIANVTEYKNDRDTEMPEDMPEYNDFSE